MEGQVVASGQNHMCPLQLQGQRSPPAATPVPGGEADKLARTEVGAMVGPPGDDLPRAPPFPHCTLSREHEEGGARQCQQAEQVRVA